jgi:hypothetical protein
MPHVTRREAIAATLAGTFVATAESPVAHAHKTDERLAKLTQAMEGFRTKMPPPQGLGEVNGFVLKELEPYTVSHLSGVAKRLGVKSRAECLVLLTYLKDTDAKLRFIAVQAIYSVVDGYLNGIDSAADNILDTRSAGHLKMVRRFAELVDKLNG